jgi:hypothetical protein
LHVIFAREAKLGLVIRRGPSKQTRLILWHTAMEQFVAGQWLKARVFERRCDLSPDGKLLIYFALDGHWDRPARGAYTAVSRPPYFTALGLWPKGDAWHGGGLFVDDHSVWINSWEGEPLVLPNSLAIIERSPYAPDGNNECLGVYFPRLRRDGWRKVDSHRSGYEDVVTWHKEGGKPRQVRLIKHAIASIRKRRDGVGVYHDEHEIQLAPDGPAIPLPDAEWADFDQRGRLCYAAGGKLWHAVFAGEELRPRKLADFGDMTFEAIRSPSWARR